MLIDLGYYPRQWQLECHKALKRFNVLALHRRAGKTELALMQLITAALKNNDDRPFYVYVAPFLKQSKAIAWARMKDRLAPLKNIEGVSFNESELTVTIKHNGAQIRVFGADNHDAMRGLRIDGAVLDEVAQMKPEVWYEIIQPALSDRKGWAMFIGTPNGINLFSELFFKARDLPDWMARRYTVDDTDALDPDEVDRLERDMAPSAFAREYLCDFAAAGDNQLISLSDVEAASQRVLQRHEYDWSPKILGVDPARFGADRSVIFPRQGLRAGTPIVMRGVNNMDLAARVAQEARNWQADAVFVDAGAGAGVIDRLRQIGVDCIEVPFGGKPIDPQYKNKRAEMWSLMAEWIVSGAIPNEAELKQDLAAPTYSYDAVGRKQLEAKDEIKKRGLPSPDMGDALALTFAMPVGAVTEKEAWVRRHSNEDISDYDPMELI
jgi:hypothetical protein